MTNASERSSPKPSHLITSYIASHDDWRGALLAMIRTVVLDADPGINEEWK